MHLQIATEELIHDIIGTSASLLNINSSRSETCSLLAQDSSSSEEQHSPYSDGVVQLYFEPATTNQLKQKK